MKKIYSLMLLFLLSVLGMTAKAVDINVDVDDKSRVYYTYNYTDYEFEQNGNNVITVNEYSNVTIKAKSGNFLTKVVKKSTNSEMYITNMTECSVYVYSSDEGETYSVTSVNADEARDATCTVKVDNASKVLLQRNNNTVVELVDGENTVKFATSGETPFVIQSAIYGTSLYKVLLDDEEQTGSNSYWRVSPADGSIIEIQANFPDIDEAVHFTYNSDDVKGAISRVLVDGVEVTNYNDDDFTVKCGSKIDVYFNTTDYIIDSFYVNGSYTYTYGGSYSITVTDETTFAINARKLATYKVKLTITDPEHITLYRGYTYYNTIVANLVSGENYIDLDENNKILSVKANSGYNITSISDNNGGTYNYDYSYGCYYITGSENLEVTIVSSEIVQDASCTVKVDDATKVRMYRSDYSTISLLNGENTVNYSSTSDVPFIIQSNTSKPLYRVLLNDEAQTANGSNWNISPESGDVITIEANYPDVDLPVAFNFSSEDVKGIISKVSIDGVEVTNYNDDNFTVKCGSYIEIYFNINDFKLNSLAVNGVTQNIYGSYYSGYVNEETTYTIDAAKYKEIAVKLTITDPEHITVYKGYSYNNNVVTGLVSGDNELSISENITVLQVVAKSGCYITEVSDNLNTQYYASSGVYTINVQEGLEVNIVSGAIERDKLAVVYVDDVSVAQYGLHLVRNDRSEVTINSGYNEVPFYDGDNQFAIQAYGSPVALLYCNGEEVSPTYPGGTSFYVTFNDGDVYKFFVNAAPVTYNVTFDVADSVDVEVVADRITKVDDLTATLAAFGGTEIKIAGDAETSLTVKVNNEAVESVDGAYTFIVKEDSNVTVELEDTGIAKIDADATSGNVYNTQGVLVLKAADAQSINNLPAGIYIMNGKKIVVK
ncbi:MAG: hypothetical protein ACI308_00190 [Muribaculaceae bacterium]